MMFAQETRTLAATALFWGPTLIETAARRARAAAKGVIGWLQRRRAASIALAEFKLMSERELRDIGLSRADVHRMAWGGSDRKRP
jgi:uncharacterized protein YjiS (DUF1127 family)